MKNKTYVMPLLLAISFPVSTLGQDNGETTEESSEQPTKTKPTRAIKLETMSVTAKQEQAEIGGINLKSLPYNSSIVSREEIERLKFVDPDELLDRIPGETQVRNLRIPRGDKSYTIPLIDGVALGSPYRGATQDITDVNSFDIERIEIIKGPVSALYPNNSFGGVINVVTRDPSIEPETRVWAEAGKFDRYRGGAHTTGTVGPMGYFFDFNVADLGLFRESSLVNGEELESENDRIQVSGKGVFNPDEVTKVTLRGMYLHREAITPGDLEQADFDLDPSGVGRPGTQEESDEYMGTFKFERELWANGYLDTNFVFRREDVEGVSRFSGPNEAQRDDMDGKIMYRHELGFMNANIIGGGEFFYGTEDFIGFATDRRTGALTGELSRSSDSSLKIFSGFAQVQISPIDRVTLTAGFRHENVDIESTDRLLNETVETSISGTKPKAGLTVDILDTHMFFFGFGQGFLAPSLSQLFTNENANPNLGSEDATNYEVGMRGSLFDDKLSYETAFYHQDISNFIVTQTLPDTPDGRPQFTFTNAGEVNLKGVESVVEYQPFDFLRLGVTHTYAQADYGVFFDRSGNDLSGNVLSRTPDHHVNGRIAVMPFEGMAIELEVDAYTGYPTNDDNNLDPDGDFTRGERLNLRATYDKGPWEVWLHALNMTDTLEDRVGFTPGRGGDAGSRRIRSIDGFTLYGGIAFRF